MQTNTLIQDISGNNAQIAETKPVFTQCAYFRQFLANFNGTLGISLPKIPRAFRRDQFTRCYIDQIPAWDEVDCLKKPKCTEREGI